mgnify:CR=1 FL=1
MQIRKKRMSRAISLAVLMAAGVQAEAQTGGLEEIVVTAQIAYGLASRAEGSNDRL